MSKFDDFSIGSKAFTMQNFRKTTTKYFKSTFFSDISGRPDYRCEKSLHQISACPGAGDARKPGFYQAGIQIAVLAPL